MQGTILLNYQEDTKKVEEEEKTRFLRSVLEQMGVPLAEFWKEDELSLSLQQKAQLRNTLFAYNIEVIDQGEDMQVYVEKEKIATWNKPTFKLQKDYSVLDPKKSLFLEMYINFWSVFEEENTS